MSKPDLTATPYGLDTEAIGWVRTTIDEMSVDEKIGQLFINRTSRFDEAFLNRIVDGYHPRGHALQPHRLRQRPGAHPAGPGPLEGSAARGVQHRGRRQRHLHRRHLVATPLQTASIPDTRAAYEMALCMKHFPGDGRDERDQHVVTSYNDCSVAEWDATYRRMWEWGIEAGIESVMVGHIMLPEYSRKLRPGISTPTSCPRRSPRSCSPTCCATTSASTASS